MKNTRGIIKDALGKLKNKRHSLIILNLKESLSDKYVIANNFNDFFINIGPTLSSKIKLLIEQLFWKQLMTYQIKQVVASMIYLLN